jgi:hypothetical protein
MRPAQCDTTTTRVYNGLAHIAANIGMLAFTVGMLAL